MFPTPLVRRASRIASAIAIILVAIPAGAQTTLRPYVGAGIGAFRVSADEVDGTSASPGLLAGVAVSRYVDVEFELLLPTGTFGRSHTGPSISFAPQGSSRDEIERLAVVTRTDRYREIAHNMSVVAIIRPPLTSRVVPGLILGVANQHTRQRTVYTPVSIPPGVDPMHPSVALHEERSTRNLGGPTFGVNLSIALTRQFQLVPDVRYDYGSIGDEINNALRTSVKMVYRF
jgi:hypothetical protein